MGDARHRLLTLGGALVGMAAPYSSAACLLNVGCWTGAAEVLSGLGLRPPAGCGRLNCARCAFNEGIGEMEDIL